MWVPLNLRTCLGNRHAWTGGDAPTRENWRAFPELRTLTRYMFRESHITCGVPLDYWKCAGTSSLERARILWSNAKFDAFRTLQHNHVIPNWCGRF